MKQYKESMTCNSETGARLSRMMIFTKAASLHESVNTRIKKEEDELQKEFLIVAYLLLYFGIGF